MDVLVIMRLLPVPLEVMLMLMMCVVAVAVSVTLVRMRVLMIMVFGQVQPDAKAHQQCGERKCRRRQAPKDEQ